MATKVTMYEAKDGSLHKTPAACDAKNVELRLAPAIEKFVNSLNPNSVGMTNSENEPPVSQFYIDLANLPDFLLAHSEALRKVLNDALVIKKPRKAATPAPPAPAPAPAITAEAIAPLAPTANDSNDLDALLEQVG